MTDSPQETRDKNEGIPLWIPIIGLFLVFIIAVVVGIRVLPTLSALVMPPSPRLPDGVVKALQEEQKGAGLDEFVYGSTMSGCQIAQFYQDWLKECVYDPGITCRNGQLEQATVPTDNTYHVARCQGYQSIGMGRFMWTVYISSGYQQENTTVFRVIREVAN
jgi:hypothetical protein